MNLISNKHLRFNAIASACMIGLIVGGCTSKKQTSMEKNGDNNELTMVVGTYTTDGNSKGIYSFRFNELDGSVKPLSEADVVNPSYLVPADDGKFIYTVSELNNENAAANAFSFNKEDGTFKFLNSQPTNGEDPCYIITNGKNVVTANYSGSNISIFPINKDGSLLPASSVIDFKGSGTDKERQEKPHLHCVTITPDGKYLLANDLGTDKIYRFVINPKANTKNNESLLKDNMYTAHQVVAGSGPRHLAFSPNGQHAYLVNELSGKVIAFNYNDGELQEIQAIQADTVNAKGGGDIHISPDGLFLYASNRLKADGLAIFSIDPDTGILKRIGYQLTGIHPRNFIITPNGKFLLVACRDSNAIEIYKRDIETGLLTNTNKDIKMDKPVCIKFVL